MNKRKILIVTIKSWNLKNAILLKKKLQKEFEVIIVSEKEDLTKEFVDKIKPDYIFFPHWSWIIPSSIWGNYQCVVFHMTDLPFGRGGSPLQNLISRKIYHTKISAIRVEQGLDTGPIYLKIPVSIETGSAQQIFKKISNIVFQKMIPQIIKNNPTPTNQFGESTEFKRLKPENSIIQKEISIDGIYDKIRMLDAEGYPKAYIDFDKLKFILSHVKKTKKGGLTAHVDIVKKE